MYLVGNVAVCALLSFLGLAVDFLTLIFVIVLLCRSDERSSEDDQ